MNLDELKQFLRIDFDGDDTLIQGLQIGAEEYLLNAGINKDYAKELYKLCIRLLVTHWYDNRESTGKADKLAFSLDAIMLQLKYNQVIL